MAKRASKAKKALRDPDGNLPSLEAPSNGGLEERVAKAISRGEMTAAARMVASADDPNAILDLHPNLRDVYNRL